ncbi:MAG: glycosyltransferase family 1 protein, partial [Propionibacteriaceae bacterium]
MAGAEGLARGSQKGAQIGRARSTSDTGRTRGPGRSSSPPPGWRSARPARGTRGPTGPVPGGRRAPARRPPGTGPVGP